MAATGDARRIVQPADPRHADATGPLRHAGPRAPPSRDADGARRPHEQTRAAWPAICSYGRQGYGRRAKEQGPAQANSPRKQDQRMARRVELGAGIVAATLAVVTFIVLLSVPLVAYCAVRSPVQPCVAVRRESLLTAGLDGGSWLYLCAMLALVLIASVGAVAEAGWGYRLGGPPLWICAALAFLGCVWAGRPSASPSCPPSWRSASRRTLRRCDERACAACSPGAWLRGASSKRNSKRLDVAAMAWYALANERRWCVMSERPSCAGSPNTLHTVSMGESNC